MFCRTCGKEILDETVICPYCGCLTGVHQPLLTGQLNVEQKVDPNSAPYNPNVNPNMTVRNDNPVALDRYGNHNTTPIVRQNMSSELDVVKPGLVVLSVLVPPAGLVVGFINKDKGKVKSGKMYIKIAVITLVVSFLNLFVVGLFTPLYS